MFVNRSLRVSILVYDLLRLLGVLWILPAVMNPPGTEGSINFPLMVYAAPNALFPLMGFFLLIKLEESRPFASLYMAGKAVVVMANLGWFFFSLRDFPQALLENAVAILFVLGFLLLLAVLDALSVLGMSMFVIHGPDKPEGGGVLTGDVPHIIEVSPAAYPGREE
jgi:asparagine N-glycosylation enzyme membrane subunit Stt3